MWANLICSHFFVFCSPVKNDRTDESYLCSSNCLIMFVRIANMIYHKWLSAHEVRQPVIRLWLPKREKHSLLLHDIENNDWRKPSSYIFLFTLRNLINIKSNEKRKILSLSFSRDLRGQAI